ncbi:unnamed protein product, partial [Didymodactylos carnosus]
MTITTAKNVLPLPLPLPLP